MKITLSNLSASPFSPLMPTPNVAEWEAIKACLAADTTPSVTDLLAEPLTFLESHRGSVLYCAGGVTVYRRSPTTSGGNGYFALPPTGTSEPVYVTTCSGCCYADARFCE